MAGSKDGVSLQCSAASFLVPAAHLVAGRHCMALLERTFRKCWTGRAVRPVYQCAYAYCESPLSDFRWTQHVVSWRFLLAAAAL